MVSDFGLIEAIEAGLLKIPQLVIRDTTGAEYPSYFNIWHWILETKLSPAERGGKKCSPKPEAILKYAHHPIAMLGGLWEKELQERAKNPDDTRPPVYILLVKNTKIAKVIYDWLAEDTFLFSGDNEEMLWIEESSLSRTPTEIRRLYDDFSVIKDNRYGCPQNFNRLTMAWYLSGLLTA